MAKLNELFKGYFEYSNDEYSRVWNNGIIVVDTNVILHFYRCSDETVEQIYKMLSFYKDRLWIPYQVASEYAKDKKKVSIDSYNDYNNIKEEISKNISSLNGFINKKKDNRLKCKKEILKEANEFEKTVKKMLDDEMKRNTPKLRESKFEENIFSLFDDRIGDKFSKEEYEKIKIEGKRRMDNDIPPGYKDKGKDENGDYYVFYSMIQKAKNEKKDIIFITDDAKEDWFDIINGERMGARPELLNEFYKESGQLFLMYSLDGFIKKYNSDTKDKVDQNAINEIKDINNKERENLYFHKNIENSRHYFNKFANYNVYGILSKYRDTIEPFAYNMIEKILINYFENASPHQKQRVLNFISNIGPYDLEHIFIDSMLQLKEDEIENVYKYLGLNSGEIAYDEALAKYMTHIFINKLMRNQKNIKKIEI